MPNVATTILVSAGNIRHKNRAVPHDFAVAAQPPACFIFLVSDMAALKSLQLTLDELDPALAAGAVAGTGSVDGHIGPPRQLQQIITGVTFNANGASALNLEGYFHAWKFLSFILSM